MAPYWELLYLFNPCGIYRWPSYGCSIPIPLLLVVVLLDWRGGGGPTKLLFIGVLLPRLFPIWFLAKDVDFGSLLTCVFPPVNELLRPLVSSFTIFLGTWPSGTPYYFLASSLLPAMSSASSSLLIIILIAFLFWRGNIISFAFMSSFDCPSCGFLNYFTLSA